MRALLCLLIAASACEPPSDPASPTPALAPQLEQLRAEYALASISVAMLRPGQPVVTHAVGDAAPGRPATADTIYSLASCSKPIVGLATAKLFALHPEYDLDTDVAEIIEWPVEHPGFPDATITFRHLLTHQGGLAADSAADYETYPKPDPDQALGPWLETLLADETYWLTTAPGAAEEYSNLGVALLAHAIEAASGQEFRAFTQQHLFDPLGLDDTRWFFGDLSASQQARHAVPFDEDGEPYAIYGFNDYPSGLLRSTSSDLARLLSALADGGGAILTGASMDAFAATPMLVEAYADDDGVQRFEHSGGEAGVNTYLTWRVDGAGYAYLINSDLDDARLDALHAELDALLMAR